MQKDLPGKCGVWSVIWNEGVSALEIPTPAPFCTSLTYPPFPMVSIIPLMQIILQKYCIFIVMRFFGLNLFFCVFVFWFVLVGKFHTVVNKTDLVGKQNFKYFCGSTTPLSTLICSYEDCVGFRERDPPQKKKKPSTQNPCISE